MKRRIETPRRDVRRWSATLIIGSAMFACLGLGAVTFAQRQASVNPLTVQRAERFQGRATLQDKTGKARAVRLAIYNWTILGRQHVAEFGEQGFLLVHLYGGKVTTVIDGKKENHATGDFWTVPANMKMMLDTNGEMATLEVTALNAP